MLVANTYGVAMSLNHASGSTQAYTSSMRLGLYTLSVSTLSLINSVSTTFGYGGATSTSATWTSSFNGARLLTFASSQWSSAPILLPGQRYWMGIVGLTNGFNGPASYMAAATAVSTAAMSGAVGAAGASASSANQWAVMRGALSATTTGPPATLALTALVGSAVTGAFLPFVRIDDDFHNYA